ncbi:MAG TPA: ribonuclease III [Arachidicoccus soli]|uniref:Ribonuclease 3 n=1 Tax=Arachidicoccus soli TaxID=2341117 RepID=A0A386HT22_9BACT|nr:ribonuclease III [Arachidicoccus soli]AYD49128.1 ribonuclease III [Arachidicoccus soli]HEU0227822.1 ribonuclease III [Arachidicoccus soli]
MLGVRPGRLSLYKRAFSHRSIKEGAADNNERLEYLGDAVLGTVVADYLFKKYPYKDEGFLTEMRSKMVNRQQLNDIAIKMGLKKLTEFNKEDFGLRNSQIFGNTLEALIGAVYLDKGYNKTKDWVLQQMLIPYLSVDDLELIEINLKNKLIGWANKKSKALSFETIDEIMDKKRRIFTIAVKLDGQIIAQGKGYNKKEASQNAAQIAVEKLAL